MATIALPRAFRLDEDEAAALAEAQLNLQAELGVEISPRQQAIMAFCAVHFGVLKAKFSAFGAERAEKIRKARQAVAEGAGLMPPGFAPPTDMTAPSPDPGGAQGPEMVRRAGGIPVATNGQEFTPLHGVPDGGKIDFGPATGTGTHGYGAG